MQSRGRERGKESGRAHRQKKEKKVGLDILVLLLIFKAPIALD